MGYDLREIVVPIPIPFSPEVSALMLAIEREHQRRTDALAADLFSPALVDQYGKPISAPRTIDGGGGIVVPVSSERSEAPAGA